jgi:alanyl-tRNA synthetase
VRSTAEIGPFVILTEGSVGSGARRIEAVTAGEAWTLLEGRSRELDAVRAELEQTRREAKKPRHEEPETAIVWQDRSGDVLVAEVTAARGGLKDVSDRLRAQEKAIAVLVGAIDDGKVALVVNLDDSVVARGVDAVQLVRSLGAHIGGGGGGRPTLAEAGGKKPEGLRDALEAGRDTLVAALR